MVEKRIAKLEDFVAKEENGQKWRRLTPLGILSQLGGTGVVIALLVYIHGTDVDRVNRMYDLQQQQATDQHQELLSIHKEMLFRSDRRDSQIQNIISRVDCLAENLKGCCKEATIC